MKHFSNKNAAQNFESSEQTSNSKKVTRFLIFTAIFTKSIILTSAAVIPEQVQRTFESRSYRQIFCDEPFTTDILAQALHYSKFRHIDDPIFNQKSQNKPFLINDTERRVSGVLGYDLSKVEKFRVPTDYVFEVKQPNRYSMECGFLSQFTLGIVFKSPEKNEMIDDQYLLAIKSDRSRLPKLAIRINRNGYLTIEHRPVSLINRMKHSAKNYSSSFEDNALKARYHFNLSDRIFDDRTKWHTIVISFKRYENGESENSDRSGKNGESGKTHDQNSFNTPNTSKQFAWTDSLAEMPNTLVVQLDCQAPLHFKLKPRAQEPIDIRFTKFYVGGNGNEKNRFGGLLRVLGLSTKTTEIGDHLCQNSMTIGATHLESVKIDANDKYRQKIGGNEGNDKIVGSIDKLEKTSLKSSTSSTPAAPVSPVLMMADDANNLPGVQLEPVCALDTRGTLYYNVDNQLQLCSGREWIHLASAGPRLDYISEYQTILLGSFSTDIEVFEIPNEGYFLISSEQNTITTLDTNENTQSVSLKNNKKNRRKSKSKTKRISSLFKWNGRTFEKYQDIRSRRVNSWTSFGIGKNTFLASANQKHGRKKTFSYIYAWSKSKHKFQPTQKFDTFTARKWTHFRNDDHDYVIVANQANRSDYTVKSHIFQWDKPYREFIKLSSLDTVGASDIVHINISEKWNFLAVANFYDGYTTKLYSTLYHIQSSDFIPYQYLETRGAFDIEFFKIGQKSFLAVANAEDVGSETLHGRYTLNSTIYEFDDLTKKFVVFQEIRTLSCLDMEYFEFGRDHYLIVVNHYDEGLSPGRTGDGRYDVKADVYKWRAVEGFKLEHSIPCFACTDFEFMEIDGDAYLFASLGRTAQIKVFKIFTY